MEPGEKCVVREGEWYNAFGETVTLISTGMRLTVLSSIYVSGMRFYSFDETPPGTYFMQEGLIPMRSLQ